MAERDPRTQSELDEELRAELQSHRKALGKTLHELAKQVGTSEQFLSSVLAGRRPPSPTVFNLLLDALDFSHAERLEFLERYLVQREPTFKLVLDHRRAAAAGASAPAAHGEGADAAVAFTEDDPTFFGQKYRISAPDEVKQLLVGSLAAWERAIRHAYKTTEQEFLERYQYKTFLESFGRNVGRHFMSDKDGRVVRALINCFLPTDIFDVVMTAGEGNEVPRAFARFVQKQVPPELDECVATEMYFYNNMAWSYAQLAYGQLGEEGDVQTRARDVERAQAFADLALHADAIARRASGGETRDDEAAIPDPGILDTKVYATFVEALHVARCERAGGQAPERGRDFARRTTALMKDALRAASRLGQQSYGGKLQDTFTQYTQQLRDEGLLSAKDRDL